MVLQTNSDVIDLKYILCTHKFLIKLDQTSKVTALHKNNEFIPK